MECGVIYTQVGFALASMCLLCVCREAVIPQNVLTYFVTSCALGGQWLTMDPFGFTFGALRLHLCPIRDVWGAALVTIGSFWKPLDQLWHALGT